MEIKRKKFIVLLELQHTDPEWGCVGCFFEYETDCPGECNEEYIYVLKKYKEIKNEA